MKIPGRTAGPRRRTFAALFAGVVLINAAMSTTSAAGTLVFRDGGRRRLGWRAERRRGRCTAVGAIALTAVTARRGRRTSLLAGYAAGVLGAVLALVGVCWPAPIALLVGMFLLGMANAGALLSRYAAAEWYAPERRGFVLGAIVWAGAIGGGRRPAVAGTVGAAGGRCRVAAAGRRLRAGGARDRRRGSGRAGSGVPAATGADGDTFRHWYAHPSVAGPAAREGRDGERAC
ncbi:MFS transporter [Fodinicola feengrottensis]|uniref:MFS transporter n=1 Tax=Fodinicola feengrottensis TaxID=435914 RepID=UPI0013D46382|nr:MFS transporter [Fodinicola feengrottensis]